jgi:hypothetical protein
METPEPDRLTRALTMLEQQQALLATVRGLAERQALQLSAIEHRLTQHDERFIQLQQTLDAIKDLLDRGNGHP